jgi:hypothetical protein
MYWFYSELVHLSKPVKVSENSKKLLNMSILNPLWICNNFKLDFSSLMFIVVQVQYTHHFIFFISY